MRVLVTGAGGFIGSHLARRLLKRGDQVRGLLLPQEDARGLDRMGMEIFRGDLTKPESIRGIANDCQVVVHAAARVLDWGFKRQFYQVGLEGTRSLLKECAGQVERFVYMSSIAAYGLGYSMKDFTEDVPLVKTGVHYGDVKIECEQLVRIYEGRGIMDVTIIRPANVLGPGSVWVKDLLDAYQRGPLPLIDHGAHNISGVFVENLVDGIILAMDSEIAKGRAYHFRDDYEVTWREYLESLGALIGKKPSVSLPFSLAWRLGRLTEFLWSPLGLLGIRPPASRLAVGVMGRDNRVDTRRAREELGWETRIPWDQAWASIEKWVKEEYIPAMKASALKSQSIASPSR